MSDSHNECSNPDCLRCGLVSSLYNILDQFGEPFGALLIMVELMELTEGRIAVLPTNLEEMMDSIEVPKDLQAAIMERIAGVELERSVPNGAIVH